MSAAGEIPRKSRNIPSYHLSFFTFLVRRHMVFKQGKSVPPFNYHTYMDISYSGNAGEILTLTLWNLWFKTKKAGRGGEADLGRRGSVPAFTLSVSPTAEEDAPEHREEFSCAESTAKPNVLHCPVPSAPVQALLCVCIKRP